MRQQDGEEALVELLVEVAVLEVLMRVVEAVVEVEVRVDGGESPPRILPRAFSICRV